MDIKKIYISGKITGQHHRRGDLQVSGRGKRRRIRRFGFEPVSPLRNGLPFEAEWADQIGEDVKLLLKSDAIYMMADWRQSEGAMIEYLVARRRRMRIFLAETVDAHASVESKTEQSHETEA